MSALATTGLVLAGCASFGSTKKRELSVLTWNVYVGGDIERVLALDAADPGYVTNLTATVTGIYRELLASDPPARMQAVANQIARLQPDLVALQEVYRLELAPATDSGPGAFTVVFDYLQLLTNALAARGAKYAVAASAAEADVTMPMVNPQTSQPAFGRIIDHDVILVRADLPPGHLQVSNPQSGHYRTIVEKKDIGLAVLRGWCSVDVLAGGTALRCICTHLEDDSAPDIQLLQAQELLNGPAQVRMPVIMMGDFNADPLNRNGTATYALFVEAGFEDAWDVLNPVAPADGLTWGHDERLADPGKDFVWRLDLVLYRGGAFSPAEIEVIDPRLDRTDPPLWPSDHAGVCVKFKIPADRAAGRRAG